MTAPLPPKPPFPRGGTRKAKVGTVTLGFGVTETPPTDPKKLAGFIDGLAVTQPEAFQSMVSALQRVGIPIKKYTDVGPAISRFISNLNGSGDPRLQGTTLENFLAAAPSKSQFATTKTKKPVEQYYLTTPEDSAAEINDAFTKILGVNATPEEQNAYYKELYAAQKKAPMVTKSTDGIVTQTAGFSKEQKEALLNNFIAKRAAKAVGKFTTAGGVEVDTPEGEKFTGEFLKGINAIRKFSAAYGVPMGEVDVKKAAISALTSPGGLDAQAEKIKNIAKGIYPGLASYIDQGLTPEELLRPYIRQKSEVMGIPEAQITLNNKQGQELISKVVTKDGLLPIYDYDAVLRKDPDWRFTKGANDEAADWVNSIFKSFGIAG
jgi:hypothetical protein